MKTFRDLRDLVKASHMLRIVNDIMNFADYLEILPRKKLKIS